MSAEWWRGRGKSEAEARAGGPAKQEHQVLTTRGRLRLEVAGALEQARAGKAGNAVAHLVEAMRLLGE